MEKHQANETQLTREIREGKKNPSRDMKSKIPRKKKKGSK